METNQIPSMIAQCVRAVAPDAEIILYGSRARGDAKPDSDWDVLILLNVDERPDYKLRTSIDDPLFDLAIDLNQRISPRIYSAKEWNKWTFLPFYKNVMKDGIRL